MCLYKYSTDRGEKRQYSLVIVKRRCFVVFRVWGWILEALPDDVSWSSLLQHGPHSPIGGSGSQFRASSYGLCWAIQHSLCFTCWRPTQAVTATIGQLWVHIQGYYFLAFISCNDPGQTIYTVSLSADLKCSNWSLLVTQRPVSSPPHHSFQRNSTSQIAFKPLHMVPNWSLLPIC